MDTNEILTYGAIGEEYFWNLQYRKHTIDRRTLVVLTSFQSPFPYFHFLSEQLN